MPQKANALARLNPSAEAANQNIKSLPYKTPPKIGQIKPDQHEIYSFRQLGDAADGVGRRLDLMRVYECREEVTRLKPFEKGERNMSGFNGGCLCGAVTYEVATDPIDVWNCHCDDCRRVTGASFATNVIVKLEDLTVTKGTPSTYPQTADNGNVKTYNFCSECGSLLFSDNSGRQDIVVVRVGCINDARFVQPSGNLFCSRALPFTNLAKDLDNFEAMPNPEEMAGRLRK